MEIREKYGIDRRSDIQGEVEEIKVNLEVMVGAEDVLLTLSKDGYVKRTSMLSFSRSGGERSSSGVKEGDYVTQLLDVNTLDILLVFTQRGQYFYYLYIRCQSISGKSRAHQLSTSFRYRRKIVS